MFRTRYRIVGDNYLGYECQGRAWWCPFWIQLSGPLGGGCNTFSTIEAAEAWIKKTSEVGRVIKQVHP